MNKISGILNVYFPFELEDSAAMGEIRQMYYRKRDAQIKSLRRVGRPRIDLMDMTDMRKSIEDILSYCVGLMGSDVYNEYEPYATESIARSFRLEREDNLFSMEISIKISDFKAVCVGVDGGCPMKGCLYYFNNLGNCVGTYLLALEFYDFSVDDVIRLKHSFYKRTLVHITEYGNQSDEDVGICETFQDYVCLKSVAQSYRRKNDIDFRARYSFLEIDDDNLSKKEKYGLLAANEKYRSVKVIDKMLCDCSKESAYELYYDLRSALIVNKESYQEVIDQRKAFFGAFSFGNGHSRIVLPESNDMIAGLVKGRFPKYLKSVELHLLTNNAQRHETVRHELSYWNPYIFLRRRYRIWKILNELDVSHCFIDGNMLEYFGVKENLNNLKEEYSQLTSHTVNYFMLIVTILAIIIPNLRYIL